MIRFIGSAALGLVLTVFVAACGGGEQQQPAQQQQTVNLTAEMQKQIDAVSKDIEALKQQAEAMDEAAQNQLAEWEKQLSAMKTQLQNMVAGAAPGMEMMQAEMKAGLDGIQSRVEEMKQKYMPQAS